MSPGIKYITSPSYEKGEDWNGSVVREYLNTDFCASAFTPEERDAILYKYQDIGWKIPEDKIFLLAWDDVISERYGFSGEDKQRSYEEDWEYMDYTGAMFQAAGRDEQENVLIAAFLYLRKYRLGEEITAEYAADLAEQIHHSEAMEEDMELSMMQEFIEMNPDRTVREMMNTNMDFSPH